MLTPPASPQSSSGSTSRSPRSTLGFYPSGAQYLKALYPYDPEDSSGTVNSQSTGHCARCLAFRSNTIIYVHSIHPSGWADGTLLSGERGWIPANHCEPYTPGLLVPLKLAMAGLSAAIEGTKTSQYTDMVASIVSSVRQLLIETDCLTRDSPLVRQYDNVRRDRKALLAELAGLVTVARRESLNIGLVAQDLFDKTERIVLRAGKFLHAIGPLTGIYRAEDAKALLIEVTPTPPVSYDFSAPVLNLGPNANLRLGDGLSESHGPDDDGMKSALRQLEATHETLLSHLAAFIGHLHLNSQPQSATHILLATRQCVIAARSLLSNLESVCSYHPDRMLDIAKDHLYTDITKFVTKARAIAGAKEGAIFDTHRLLEIATGVVKGAGLCTSRAYHLLETLGDFSVADFWSESASGKLNRDDTSSSLASSADHRQSRDVQAQVESLSIPYKKVAALSSKSEPDPDDLSQPTDTGRGLPGTDVCGPLSSPKTKCDDVCTTDPSPDDLEITFNQDGQILGATLASLVECMTPDDRMPDAFMTSAFYLTFRLFVLPELLADLLVTRYRSTWGLAMDSDQMSDLCTPIRLRVYNFFKSWLESYWRADTDFRALDIIESFASTELMADLPQAGKRLASMASHLRSNPNKALVSLLGKSITAIATDHTATRTPPPPPVITRAQIASLRASTSDVSSEEQSASQCCIIDFDDLELARQLTLIESRLYCAITPVELIGQEFSKKLGTSLATNVKAMSAASTDIAGWVSESILCETEQKRRTLVLKHWIKIGERCAQLNNYNTLMAIMCALNSSTIARLKRTWDGLGRSYKTSLDHLRSITDHQRNYAVYRAKVRQADRPCLPFLGLYLTDLVFVDEGNPSHRLSKTSARSLINFDKHVKTSKIVSELQHTQAPYNLQEVPELVSWISAACLRMRKSAADLPGNLWRRSLILEPKLPATMRREPSVASSADSESWSNKKLGFLSNW